MIALAEAVLGAAVKQLAQRAWEEGFAAGVQAAAAEFERQATEQAMAQRIILPGRAN